MRRVFVIHWRPTEAAPLLKAVRQAGFAAECCEGARGDAVTKALRENPPDVVAIDLSRLPSHGREVAVWLRGRKATRHIPLVFVGGAAAKVARTRELLPDAAFTETGQLGAVLRSLPAAVLEPSIPVPLMKRYENRTAAQKMGIREGSSVTLVDAPRDYLIVLGEVPSGAELFEGEGDEQGPARDVTLWFVHEPDTFCAALPFLRRIAPRTKLWVLWRKGSRNGITGNFVRQIAIDAGLVDYKICSVDGHWSGIAFALAKR